MDEIVDVMHQKEKEDTESESVVMRRDNTASNVHPSPALSERRSFPPVFVPPPPPPSSPPPTSSDAMPEVTPKFIRMPRAWKLSTASTQTPPPDEGDGPFSVFPENPDDFGSDDYAKIIKPRRLSTDSRSSITSKANDASSERISKDFTLKLSRRSSTDSRIST